MGTERALQFVTIVVAFSTFSLVSGQVCPWGWVDYPGSRSCYQISDYKVRYTFPLAVDMCKAYGATLARIDDKAELEWLKSVFSDLNEYIPPKMSWWVGLEDKAEGKGVLYDDGTVPTLPTLFGPDGLPAPSSEWSCGSFVNETVSMNRCTRWLGALCERDKNQPLTCDVDNGWTFLNNSCYKLYSDLSLTWDDARIYCKNENADLATIPTEEALSLALHLTNTSQCWIGLKSEGAGKQYVWTDGTVVDSDYQPTWWADNEPDQTSKFPMCAIVSSDNHRRSKSWHTTSCTDKKAFLCKKPQGVCAAGWIPHQTSCFRFFLDPLLSWTDARDLCQIQGADLLTLSSAAYQSTLNSYLVQMSGASVDGLWLGLSSNNGVYTWTDGSSIDKDSYTNWESPQQKNAAGNQNCVYINSDDRQGKWQTATDCNEKKAFVCSVSSEKVVTKPVTTAAPCAHGWVPTQTSCLFLSDARMTQQQSKTACDQLQATLLVDDSVTAHNNVLNVPRDELVDYWIGLTRTESGFTWTNGNKMEFTKWSANSPTSDVSCVTAGGKDFNWTSTNCNEAQSYICQRAHDQFTAAPVSVTYSGKCGIGWEERPGSDECYQFVETLLNWEDAKTACSNHGGFLLSIAGVGEQSYIEGRLGQKSTTVYWIGLSDTHLEGNWKWEDGTPTAYFNWFAGEPNDMGTENCAAIHTHTMNWYDYKCTLMAASICKKTAFSATTTTEAVTTKVSLPPNSFYGCKQGWLGYGSSCFQINVSPSTWSQAQFACRQQGAELASIGSVMENDFVWSQIPTDPCQDLHSNSTECQFWAQNGECQINSGWMVANCQRSCNMCGTPCADKMTTLRCQFWANIGECQKNYPYMSENCARSCGCNRSLDSGYWLGLNDLRTQMSYEWSDHSDMTYINWRANEPDNFNGGSEDCVRINKADGQWSDELCDLPNTGFICETPMTVRKTGMDVSTLNVGCSFGSFGYYASCYTLVDRPKTWQDAQRYCKGIKGNLATVNDGVTSAFITSELLGKTLSYWLGLYSVDEGYKWISGENVMYTPWAPSHVGVQNNSCVAVLSQSPVGLWVDSPCQVPHPFICETPRKGFTKSTTVATTSPKPTTPAPCETGWVGNGDMCYKAFTNIRRTFAQAETICAQYGASLPSVHDTQTNYFIASNLFDSLSKDTFWLGLTDADKEGSFVWVDGSPFDYNSWNYGEPNNRGTENCVTGQLLYGSSKWNDISCNSVHKVVCAAPRGFPLHTPPPTQPSTKAPLCPGDNWLFHRGFCYFVSPATGKDAKLNWFEAQRFCASHGGDLTSISTHFETEFLVSILLENTENFYWIGLNQLSKDEYGWLDGSPRFYSNWLDGEPNDGYGAERCVDMTLAGFWRDDLCIEKKRFICKRVNGTVPKPPLPTPIISGDCPPGFLSLGGTNKCYTVRGLGNDTSGDPPLSWTDAMTWCNQNVSSPNRVDLASIDSRLDQAFLTLLLEGLTSDLWIGFNDRRNSGTFFWHDNTEITYTNWAKGYPRTASHSIWDWNYYSQQCVKMLSKEQRNREVGDWVTERCEQKLPFICKTNRVPSSTPKPVTQTTPKFAPHKEEGCPSTFYRFRSTCFTIVNQEKTWAEARQACQFFQGDLASIQDVFELSRLDLQLFWSRVLKPAWIGLNYQHSDQFVWSDEWPVSKLYWTDSDPDFVNKDNNSTAVSACVSMYEGKWNDTNCEEKKPFICEVRDQPPTTVETYGDCANPDHVPFGRYCYIVNVQAQVSWSEANYQCSQQGMELVSLHSATEQQFLLNILYVTLNDEEDSSGYSLYYRIWLGLRRDSKGAFRWQDGSTPDYFDWATHEPSGIKEVSANTLSGYSKECVAMHSDTGNWYNMDCVEHNNVGYACRTSAILPTTLPPTTTTTTPRMIIPSSTGSKTNFPPFIPGGGRKPYDQGPSDGDESSNNLPTTQAESQSLSGGQIAGIVIGAVGFGIIVLGIAVIIRARLQSSKSLRNILGIGSGFDNALYNCQNTEEVGFTKNDAGSSSSRSHAESSLTSA